MAYYGLILLYLCPQLKKEVVIQDGRAYINYGSAIFSPAIAKLLLVAYYLFILLFIVLIPAEILFYYKSHITDWTLVLFL